MKNRVLHPSVVLIVFALGSGSTGAGDTDMSPPTITLLGDEIFWAPFGTEYSDPGAFCVDDVDGDITSQIVVVNPVNTSVSGIYTITYNCTDSSGNQAVEVIRTVAVESDVGDLVSVGLVDVPVENGRGAVLVALTAPTTNFTADDLSIVNASVTLFQQFEKFARFILVATADGEFSVRVEANAFTDTDGNPNRASNTLAWIADFGPPSITLESSAPSLVVGPIAVVATLSETSADFTADDVQTTNSMVSSFSGSGSSYSFSLIPLQSGAFSVLVGAETFTDGFGNGNTASNVLSRTADLAGTCFYRLLFESEWPLMAEDLELLPDTITADGPGRIPERWAIAMVRQVLCRPEHPWHGRTLEAFNHNVTSLENEPPAKVSRVEPYKHVLGALLLVSQGRQSFFKALLDLTGDYQTVRGNIRSEGEQPFSEGGDLDGDGFSNEEEYVNVVTSGGDIDDFADAVSNPKSRGIIGMPALSALGLAFMILSFVLLLAWSTGMDHRVLRPGRRTRS